MAAQANQVRPTVVVSNGLYPPWGKKWTIQCGACRHTWKKRLPVAEPASAVCPACRAQNVWSLGGFAKHYERTIEA